MRMLVFVLAASITAVGVALTPDSTDTDRRPISAFPVPTDGPAETDASSAELPVATAPVSTAVSTAPAASTTSVSPTPVSTTPDPSVQPAPATLAPELANCVTPESQGAVGDGTADDQRSLQQAFDAATRFRPVCLAAGRTYRHSGVLLVRVQGQSITGTGVLLASDEQTAAVHVTADQVTIDGPTLRAGVTTQRWTAPEHHMLRLSAADTIVKNVLIDGSPAAGIFVQGASGFLIEDVTVQNTRADGIQMTSGSHDGVVRRPHTINSGDDGIAVVSYQGQLPSQRIAIESPKVEGTAGGRGISVVGGEDITYTNIDVENSDSAGVYIAVEPAYSTISSRRIRILGGVVTNANRNPTVKHGAILIYSGRPGYEVDDVVVSGISVIDTQGTAPWEVGLVGPGTFSNILFADLAITGTRPALHSEAATATYATVGVTVNDVPLEQ